MKKLIAVLFLLFSLGCEKISQPTQPQSNPADDQVLMSKIVGHWKAGSNWNYTFRADSTFIDSFFTPSPTSFDTTIYVVAYVVRGSYAINNAVMTFPSMELVYADTSLLLPFFYETDYIYYPHKVEFKNDMLVLNLMDVLSPVNGDGKAVNGYWQTDNWIVAIERRPTNTAYFGKIKKEYYFNVDSQRYSLKISNTFGSPYQVQSDSGAFSYSSSYYSFGVYSGKPELADGKLLLNYGMWPIFNYEKVE